MIAGYAPAIGFLHGSRPRSFIYDIADLFKFRTVVPLAFSIAGSNPADPERAVRHACRDAFRKTKMLEQLIPAIDNSLRYRFTDDGEGEDDDIEGIF